MSPVEPTSLDDEIDLRPYILTLIKHWRLIVGITVIAAALALGSSFVLPPLYQAGALVVVTNPRFVLNFDSKIQTTTATNDQSLNSKAFLGLANSDQLLADLANAPALADLPAEARNAGSLREQLRAVAGASPTLLEFRVEDADPARAAAIANAWSGLYVNYVNELYGYTQNGDTVFAVQVDSARVDYTAAQQALEAFLKDNRLATLGREIETRQNLLAVWQSGLDRGQALGPARQAANRRQLLSDAYTELLEQDRQERWLLDEYYGQIASAEQLLRDAAALRDQVQAGGSASADQANALAQILLRSRALAGSALEPIAPRSAALPSALTDTVQSAANLTAPQSAQALVLQVSVGQPAGPVLVSDVDSLIAVLQARRTAAQAQLTALLDLAQRQTPDSAVAVDARLAALAERRAELHNRLQTLSAGLYVDLLEAPAPADNQPAREVARLDQEILSLQADLEIETARQLNLTQARDLAWDTYTILLRKAEERHVAAQTGDVVVRLASAAAIPQSPVGHDPLLITLVAAVAGMVLGGGAVLFWSWWKTSDLVQ